jgi:hypothetical protein
MSEILATFLEEELKPNLTEEGTFSEVIQEEYLDFKGRIDRDYICRKLGIHLSKQSFRKTVKQTLGRTEFTLVEVHSSVSLEEFETLYEFGVYRPREWVGQLFKKTGKLLTRSDAVNFILRVK